MNPVSWPNQSREFLGEVRSEFKKVTWPSERETVAGTVSVVVVVAIIGAALAGIDFLLSKVMQAILP